MSQLAGPAAIMKTPLVSEGGGGGSDDVTAWRGGRRQRRKRRETLTVEMKQKEKNIGR
jgi:hypothetical protein